MKTWIILASLLSTSVMASEVCEVGTVFRPYRQLRLAMLKCSDHYEGGLGFQHFWLIDTDASADFGLGHTQGTGFEEKDTASLKKSLLDAGFHYSYSGRTSETWAKD